MHVAASVSTFVKHIIIGYFQENVDDGTVTNCRYLVVFVCLMTDGGVYLCLVFREFLRTAWEDIERFKDQRDRDLREALISYAIMQISMCKKVRCVRVCVCVCFAVSVCSCMPKCLKSERRTDCCCRCCAVSVKLTLALWFCHCHRESRCGPTPRSVSTKCETSPRQSLSPAPCPNSQSCCSDWDSISQSSFGSLCATLNESRPTTVWLAHN